MTKRYITIDGGTTNTRVCLVVDGVCLRRIRLSIGARACIDHRAMLENELKLAIQDILEEFELCESDIIRILASGMITSEFGLCELPHVSAPAGIRELHDTMAEVTFPEISSIPFVFVRGVRIISESLAEVDVMRGEETELMGLMALAPQSGKSCVFVLPGSHSKLINTVGGKISAFSTMLTGEMIMSLSQGTILKDAVDLSVSDHDENYLVEGYRFAKNEGINKALFKVRILKNIFKRSPQEVYSFFLGAILADEIDAILSSSSESVIIGGNNKIKTATAALLSAVSDKSITVISDEDVERSTAVGVISIFEYK
ncbi:MAG: 2-dehydro-3-deoxygalactonokinase [Clostridia bacterium]|nr:2-dehydro-3-deoxygalactonokinase [Clostridia bacterium]